MTAVEQRLLPNTFLLLLQSKHPLQTIAMVSHCCINKRNRVTSERIRWRRSFRMKFFSMNRIRNIEVEISLFSPSHERQPSFPVWQSQACMWTNIFVSNAERMEHISIRRH
jgi:hypothetical protein